MNGNNQIEDSDNERYFAEDYDVRFDVVRSLTASEEPSEYVFDVDGTIQIANEHGASEVIGWISARVVQAGRACNHGEPLFDVCDSVDQSLHEYASAVYNWDDERIKESISDGCAGADILIIESIQIVPAHRGRRLGLLAMRRTIDTFGTGCALVVIKPFPLQFSGGRDLSSSELPNSETRMAMKSFAANKKAACMKLRKYWAQLGFERIGKTDYFALDLQYKQPDYKELMQ